MLCLRSADMTRCEHPSHLTPPQPSQLPLCFCAALEALATRPGQHGNAVSGLSRLQVPVVARLAGPLCRLKEWDGLRTAAGLQEPVNPAGPFQLQRGA